MTNEVVKDLLGEISEAFDHYSVTIYRDGRSKIIDSIHFKLKNFYSGMEYLLGLSNFAQSRGVELRLHYADDSFSLKFSNITD